MKIAYLEIRTWVGSSVVWYAEHYYGKIRFGDKQVDVEYRITKEDVDKLNTNNREDFFPGSKYRVGEETTRFHDKKRLLEEATKLFKKDPHGCDALLEGDRCWADPMKMLVGPKGIKGEANRQWRLFEARNGWGCPEEEEAEVRKITNRWDKIVGVFYER